MGISANGRVLVLTHTERHDKIRIISCRKATASERRFYEEDRV
ncbi:MAG: BrnT family toxin [Thermodesulfovibrionia bacterium]|nr:BrnT family toxin [Thermodesulfovibrionia bacterium]